MLQSFYPVLCSDRSREVADFYIRHFGFVPTFESDWYISLRRDGARPYELAVVDASHPTVPEGYRRPAQGILLNFEVEDVDSEWRRLVDEAGLEPALTIRSEAFGQRHFILVDPGGVLIDVIMEIPPGAEYADQFAS